MDDLLKEEIPWLDKADYFMGLKKEAAWERALPKLKIGSIEKESSRAVVGALMTSSLMGGLAYTRYKPDPKTSISSAERDAMGQLKAHTSSIDTTTSNPSGLDRLKRNWIEAKLKGARRAGNNPAKAGLFWAIAGAPVGAILAKRLPIPAMRASSLLKMGKTKTSGLTRVLRIRESLQKKRRKLGHEHDKVKRLEKAFARAEDKYTRRVTGVPQGFIDKMERTRRQAGGAAPMQHLLKTDPVKGAKALGTVAASVPKIVGYLRRAGVKPTRAFMATSVARRGRKDMGAEVLRSGKAKYANPQVRGRMLSALRRLHPGAKKPRPARGPGPSVMGEAAPPTTIREGVATAAGREPVFIRPENLRAPAKVVEPPVVTGPTVVPAPPMAPPEEASLTTIPYRMLRGAAPFAAVGAGGALAHRAFAGPPPQQEYPNAR